MKKINKKNKVKNIILMTVESAENFFARGKETAALLDKKKSLSARRVISFEDPDDFMNFLTENKLRLVAAIRKSPNSVSKLAVLLHRSRAAIGEDVRALEAIGILKSEYVANPGHGRQRVVKIADNDPIQLQMVATL